MDDPSEFLASVADRASKTHPIPERVIQEYLSENLHLLGVPGISLVEMEHSVPSGRIDILASGPNGLRIAIEVKRGYASREAIGQLQAYIGDLMDEHASAPVQGILVAAGLDQGARSALLATSTIEFFEFATEFSFSHVPVKRPTLPPAWPPARTPPQAPPPAPVPPPIVQPAPRPIFPPNPRPSPSPAPTTRGTEEKRFCCFCNEVHMAYTQPNGDVRCRNCMNQI